MKKYLFMFLLGCGTVHAEWYRVDAVPAYNRIKASKADGEAQPVVIRIRNLEKIEYIQPDAEKVLMGGREAVSLAKNVLLGQVVWVENLQPEEGAYVADIYPSFEQVIRTYKENRMVSGDNLSKGIKGKIKIIYKQMLADLNLSPMFTEKCDQAQEITMEVRSTLHGIYTRTLGNIRSATPKILSTAKDDTSGSKPKLYAGSYQRAVFTADAIVWFREKGQNMHPMAQKLFVDLLQDFQGQSDTDARFTQIKLKEIMGKGVFFTELFMNTTDFERGKFTYTCLDWFKNRGQYLPADVQNLFVTWLRVYQQTHSSGDSFMKQRLQWMMDNNKLYQDFLELGNP